MLSSQIKTSTNFTEKNHINILKKNFSIKTKTELVKPTNICITKRYMLRSTSKVVTEIAQPLNFNSITQTKTYATYIVTEEPAEQDISKVQHPIVVKTECDNVKCNDINYTIDNKNCDIDSEESAIIGLRSRIYPKLDTNRTAIHFENYSTEHGQITTIILSEKEPIIIENRYNTYKDHESKVLQQEENTEKLNKRTKNQPTKRHEHETNDI